MTPEATKAAVDAVAKALRTLSLTAEYQQFAEAAVASLQADRSLLLGLLGIEDEHFVTFDENGWFIEHSIQCRIAGTLGTCEFNDAIRDMDETPEPGQFGRWLIVHIDEEGLPSLERALAGDPS